MSARFPRSFAAAAAAVVAPSACASGRRGVRGCVGSCPTGRECSKGGVCRPSEDKDSGPKETGPHLQNGGQGSLPKARSVQGAVTPSFHLGVPKSLPVTPACGEGIRQQLGWRKVCGTDLSGFGC